MRALIDGDDARLLGPAGSDHLGSERLGGELLFEFKQGLQSMGLVRILPEAHLLHPQPLNLFLQLAVLLAHPAQVGVIVPAVAEEMPSGNKQFFDRSESCDGPDANQPCAASAA